MDEIPLSESAVGNLTESPDGIVMHLEFRGTGFIFSLKELRDFNDQLSRMTPDPEFRRHGWSRDIYFPISGASGRTVLMGLSVEEWLELQRLIDDGITAHLRRGSFPD